MSTVYEAHGESSGEDLRVLQRRYESELPNPSNDTAFNYGWGLIRSPKSEHIELGIVILQDLLGKAPTLRREARYYLALGYYKLGRHTEARNYAAALLREEPDNAQARDLVQSIDSQVQKDGLIGMAIVGGAVAAIGMVVGLLTRK